MSAKKHFVISYDVTLDKNRRKIAKILTGYGIRVQYSVFECFLTSHEMDIIIAQVNPYIDPKK